MVRLLLRSIAVLAMLSACAFGATRATSQTDRLGTYSLILVDADSSADLTEAKDFIASQGGTIAIILPPRAIIGWIPERISQKLVGSHRIRSIHQSPLDSALSGFQDADTIRAISSFNEITSGRLARRRAREDRRAGPQAERPVMLDCSLPHPSINKDEFIRNLRLLGAEQSVVGIQSSVTPQYLNNSDVMDGTVAVAVFLVESNGGLDPNTYTWSQADQSLAVSEVLDGLTWWVTQSQAFHLSRPLQFVPRFF